VFCKAENLLIRTDGMQTKERVANGVMLEDALGRKLDHIDTTSLDTSPEGLARQADYKTNLKDVRNRQAMLDKQLFMNQGLARAKVQKEKKARKPRPVFNASTGQVTHTLPSGHLGTIPGGQTQKERKEKPAEDPDQEMIDAHTGKGRRSSCRRRIRRRPRPCRKPRRRRRPKRTPRARARARERLSWEKLAREFGGGGKPGATDSRNG